MTIYAVVLICGLALLSGVHLVESRRPGWTTASTTRFSILSLASSRRSSRKPSSSSASSQGFGVEPLRGQAAEETSANAKRIYSMPALYDLAFGYRNHEEEVDFLVGQHQALHNGKAPSRILELAAGPARHSIYALQSALVKSATALDNSAEMVDYGMTIASEELDVETQASFTYVKADMTSFDDLNGEASEGKFDSAWILLGSLQHLTTNPQVISCFECINNVLTPGGTLILELPHPRETFSMVECTRNGWEVPLEDENGEPSGELEIIWGDDNDEFDPVTQVRQFTVAMELTGDAVSSSPDLQNVREVVPLRLFTSQEIDALARIAGFEVSSLHGALADGVEVNDEDEAFRLVCVLKKL